jgi:hypothetical protein
MSKRSFDESRGNQPSEADHNGLLAIHELLSPDEQDHDPTPPAGQTKRPRNFIATVVCPLLIERVCKTCWSPC